MDTINRYGYRHFVSEIDAEAATKPYLGPGAEQAQRREKGTNRPFIPCDFRILELQWEHLKRVREGKSVDMSRSAAVSCQRALERVFRFRASEGAQVAQRGQLKRRAPRIEFKNIELNHCQCEGGETHFELPIDDVVDELRDLMARLANAASVDEAHELVSVIDAVHGVLANHNVVPNWPQLWNEACPPIQCTIPVEEWARYKAWDRQWRVVSESPTTGEMLIERPRHDLFQRAKSRVSEMAARLNPRPYEPPADWTPPKPDDLAE